MSAEITSPVWVPFRRPNPKTGEDVWYSPDGPNNVFVSDDPELVAEHRRGYDFHGPLIGDPLPDEPTTPLDVEPSPVRPSPSPRSPSSSKEN